MRIAVSVFRTIFRMELKGWVTRTVTASSSEMFTCKSGLVCQSARARTQC